MTHVTHIGYARGVQFKKKQHEAKRKVTIQAQVTQQTSNTLTASLGR